MHISIPKEYESLSILQRQIGDIKTIKYFCYLWNHYNNADTLRYKGDDGIGEIVITGKCADLEESLRICRLITSFGVAVRHEETRFTVNIDVEV